MKQFSLFDDAACLPDFDGDTYERDKDHARLGAQLQRVAGAMRDGRWRTLRRLADLTGDPEASISARLRDLRKQKFGGWSIERRRCAEAGTWEYRWREPAQ